MSSALCMRLIIVSFATYCAAATGSGGDADFPAAVFLLDKRKIDEYRPLALAGDREKALAIYSHYSMFEDNDIDAEFWLRVIAEHDDCYAIKEYVRRARATPPTEH